MKHLSSFFQTLALFSRPSRARSHARFLLFFKVAALAGLLLATSGCASIFVRWTWNHDKLGAPEKPKPPYIGVGGNVILSAYFLERSEKGPHLLPLFIISLPFDFALDTVCLPYDIFSYFWDKCDQWFWERVFEKNDTSLSLEEYLKHLTRVGKRHAYRLLGEDAPDKTGKADPATQKNKGKISPEMRQLYKQVTRIHEAEENINLYRDRKEDQKELAKWTKTHADLIKEWDAIHSSPKSPQPSPQADAAKAH